MTLPPNPLHNRLLAAFPAEDLRRWLPLLAPVDLTRGQVLQESGRLPHEAWFPTTAAVSLLYLSENGGCDGFGVIGRREAAELMCTLAYRPNAAAFRQ